MVLLGIAVGKIHTGVGSTNRAAMAPARCCVANRRSDIHRDRSTAPISPTIHQTVAHWRGRDRPVVDLVVVRHVHCNVLGCLGFAVK